MSTSHRSSLPSDESDLVGPRTERDLRRFEAYCRWSLHLLIGFVGLVIAMTVTTVAQENPWLLSTAPILGVLGAVCTALWVAFAVFVLDGACRERTIPRPLMRLFTLFSLIVTFAFALCVPPGAPARLGVGMYSGLGPLGLAVSLGVLATLLPWRQVVVLAVAGIAVLGAVLQLGPPRLDSAVTAAMITMAAWFSAASVAMTLSTRWMIGVVRRLWRSRQVAADLAVAEERLRFSRDLHDVVGRTLATVAVKSELAAELARRGDERAVVEMEAVREIAQTALSDVRGLVRGYRRIELSGELAGARGVLRAAGMTPVVAGDVDTITGQVAPEAADALAWTVREGVTNVLRHGAGRHVRIGVIEEPGWCGIVIENTTTLRGSSGSAYGSGLVGLRERVDGVGGSMQVAHEEGTFRLTARVPIRPGAETARA